MFTNLFGSELPLAARFLIAFVVVLALIGLTAWLVRRFGASRLGGSSARGRQPRLAVIDAATVDGRRRLVLIRRDNVEHLLMIGGPTDVVIEPNIVRAVAAREPGRMTVPPEPIPRVVPAAENGWPLQPVSEPPPLVTPRSYRSTATEEPWHPPEPGARARPPETLSDIAAELSSRLNRPESTPLRAEPVEPRANAPVEPPASPQTDHNLAAMAQQLEAALRRTAIPEARPPVTDALASPPKAGSNPLRDFKLRLEPKAEVKPEPKPEVKIEPKPKVEPKPELKVEPAPEVKVEPKPVVEPKPEPKIEAPAAKIEPPPPPRSEPAPKVEPPPAAKIESAPPPPSEPPPVAKVEPPAAAKAEPPPAPKQEPPAEAKIEPPPAPEVKEAQAEPPPAAKIEPPTAEAKAPRKAEPPPAPKVEAKAAPKAEPPAAKIEPPPAPRPAPSAEAKPAPKSEPKLVPEPKPEPAAATTKEVFDSFEEEMASLLGRPLGKS